MQNMTIVRVKGIKRYRVRGRWYAYHRRTKTSIKSEFGTGAFFAELAAIEKKLKRDQALPGTVGGLLACYRASPTYADLAPATKVGYGRMMNILQSLHEMPLAELTPQFIAQMRDRLAETRGRRIANYVMAVVSVACEHGKEHGILSENPVSGVKRVRRARNLAHPNRPWTREERRTVLDHVSPQLRVPVALAMFTGLRKSDVLTLTKSAIKNGQISRRTGKTGYEVSLPVHPDLARLLAEAPPHSAVTVAATGAGTPWTVSGFNSSFIKAVAKLKVDGKVGAGLTFHGLRHTVGTHLVEAGCDIDTVRRWLGQKTLAMAIHYSETADTSRRMRNVLAKFDPLGSKKRT
jgi:integrase